MRDQIKAQARHVITRRKGVDNLATPKGEAKRINVPHVTDYSKIHPQVLDHVHRYLDEFKKGLSNGRR